MARTPYDILGVTRRADEAEITRAYRKLAKEHHPDLHPGDKKAEERFKEVSAAYDILGDKAKRSRYDRGEIDEQGRERGFAAGQPGGGFQRRSGRQGQRNFEFRTSPGGQGFAFDDIISELFGGQRGGGQNGPVPGEDLRLALEIDFRDAARGGVKRVALPTGETVDLTIPPGVESGQTLRLRGKGQAVGAGPPGDALVEIKVRPDQQLRRDGLDITLDQQVPLETAILGGKIRVPTIDAEVSLSVPAGSTSGRVLRLRGRGIKDAKTGNSGDQLVRLLVDVPSGDPELKSWASKRAAVSA